MKINVGGFYQRMTIYCYGTALRASFFPKIEVIVNKSAKEENRVAINARHNPLEQYIIR